MSKMSQLHAELTEQAYEIGFESLGEAEQAGYGVDWVRAKLISPQEMAHNEWVEERDRIVQSLVNAILHNRKLNDGKGTYEQTVMQEAINFIKKGEV